MKIRTQSIVIIVGFALSSAAIHAADYGRAPKRRAEADCLIGLWAAPSDRTFECTDCDPSCDADGTGVSNGACTFQLQVCVNLEGVPGCQPAALKRLSAKPKALFPLTSTPTPPPTATSACGAFTDVVVSTRRGGTRPGRKQIRLAARSLGQPKQSDSDTYQFVCRPTPPGQTCGTSTTTTTLPNPCGNSRIDAGEQCDGTALGGATCASRGFIGGTLACTNECAFDVGACTGAPTSCTIDMDATCPDLTPECGASFAGGAGCLVEGKAGCYASGSKSYKVAAGQLLVIVMTDDITGLDVFFAGEGAASGTMTFLDPTGQSVGPPLTTNGNCLAGMPSRQQVTFTTPVHTIEVGAAGGTVWLDSFAVSR